MHRRGPACKQDKSGLEDVQGHPGFVIMTIVHLLLHHMSQAPSFKDELMKSFINELFKAWLA